jgi:hypothetical protein
MIQAFYTKQINNAAVHPGFWISRPINDTTDAGMHDRPGTHGARFKGYEQFAPRQAVIPQNSRRIAQGGNFGVRGRIALADWRIEATPDDLAIQHDNRTNRHFTEALGCAGQGYGLAHEEFVTDTGNGILDYSHSIVAGGLPETS